ncbi:MAG: hypothetical protein KAG53_09725 [Endozoicomonadaceae bacterium]|nr:hypothetical protein [Endozoicomonadaceae bacterium]
MERFLKVRPQHNSTKPIKHMVSQTHGVKSCFVPFLCERKGLAIPLRIEYAGALYHVTSCGNAQEEIYRNDKDFLVSRLLRGHEKSSGFASLAASREWVDEFSHWYNEKH